MLGHQLQELSLGDVAGGELGADVAKHFHRDPDIGLDQTEQRLVPLALLEHVHGRDAETFLVDLG